MVPSSPRLWWRLHVHYELPRYTSHYLVAIGPQGRILRLLRERYGSDFSTKVAVCAPTGIAATHINGGW